MPMVVPVENLSNPGEFNRRRVPPIPKSLKNQDPKRFPPLYMFNVGPRRWEFPPNDRGSRFLEACPKGKPYSDALVIPNIVMEIYDLADGGGNMGRLEEDGIDVALGLIHGGPSGPKLSLDTANLEWFGVFVTENEVPTKLEIDNAKKKLHQMMRLVYDTGSSLVSQNADMSKRDGDKVLFNEAAEFLGLRPLWGTDDHIAERCVFCQENIRAGAVLCRHCNSRQDTPEAKELRKKAA